MTSECLSSLENISLKEYTCSIMSVTDVARETVSMSEQEFFTDRVNAEIEHWEAFGRSLDMPQPFDDAPYHNKQHNELVDRRGRYIVARCLETPEGRHLRDEEDALTASRKTHDAWTLYAVNPGKAFEGKAVPQAFHSAEHRAAVWGRMIAIKCGLSEKAAQLTFDSTISTEKETKPLTLGGVTTNRADLWDVFENVYPKFIRGTARLWIEKLYLSEEKPDFQQWLEFQYEEVLVGGYFRKPLKLPYEDDYQYLKYGFANAEDMMKETPISLFSYLGKPVVEKLLHEFPPGAGFEKYQQLAVA